MKEGDKSLEILVRPAPGAAGTHEKKNPQAARLLTRQDFSVYKKKVGI